MNGNRTTADLTDLAYNFLQVALTQNIGSLVDGGEFDVVWSYDDRDACERICQIVIALGALHQMTVPA